MANFDGLEDFNRKLNNMMPFHHALVDFGPLDSLQSHQHLETFHKVPDTPIGDEAHHAISASASTLQHTQADSTSFSNPGQAVPIQFEIESLYEDLDRHRQQANRGEVKTNLRRRAQNRASQRAFRERKDKHVKEVEDQFYTLECKYNDLTAAYETLQQEYLLVKAKLDNAQMDDNAQVDDEEGSATVNSGTSIVENEGIADVPRHHSLAASSVIDHSSLSATIWDESVFHFDQYFPGSNHRSSFE